MASPDDSGGKHRLTQLSAMEGRQFERHNVSLPCRMTYTMQHMRGVRTVFALASNLSRSGVLLITQNSVGDMQYVAIELSPGAAPDPAVVRRRRDNELGCEFLTPLSARRFTELLHAATAGTPE